MENEKNISKRHNTRLLAVSVLYAIDLNKDFENLDGNSELVDEYINDIIEMNYSDEEIVDLYDLDFLRSLVKGSLENLCLINQLIIEHLTNWTIDRLSYVDRAIIRLSVHEMLENKIPKNIILDEALEITKELSSIDGEKQVKFTNRLLDNIAGKIYARA